MDWVIKISFYYVIQWHVSIRYFHAAVANLKASSPEIDS